jgi:hypothetical protein
VAPEKLVLGEESVEGRLLFSEISADREKLLEMVTHDLQAGQSAGRAWLECRVVATERRIEVVDRNREWHRPVSRTAFSDIGDRCLGHESFLLVPESLQKVVREVSWHNAFFPIYRIHGVMTVKTCLHIIKDNLCFPIVVINYIQSPADRTSETSTPAESAILQRGGPVGATPHRWPPEIPSV